MRGNFDFRELEKNFSKFFNSHMPLKQLKLGITQVLDNPTLETKFTGELYIPSFNFDKMMIFLIGTWYLEDERLGWLIREAAIEKIEKSKRFDDVDKAVFRLVLEDKNETRLYFAETALWHPREIFGNYLPSICKKLHLIHFKTKNTRPPREQRRIGVGYKDKGSSRQSGVRAEKDWSLDKLHQEIEEERRTARDSIDFIRGSGG